MASVALSATTHSILSRARTPALKSSFLTAVLTPLFAFQPPWPLSLQTLLDLLPPFILAVPKKKTSHSRKAMRSANKGLKDKRSKLDAHSCTSRNTLMRRLPQISSAVQHVVLRNSRTISVQVATQ